MDSHALRTEYSRDPLPIKGRNAAPVPATVPVQTAAAGTPGTLGVSVVGAAANRYYPPVLQFVSQLCRGSMIGFVWETRVRVLKRGFLTLATLATRGGKTLLTMSHVEQLRVELGGMMRRWGVLNPPPSPPVTAAAAATAAGGSGSGPGSGAGMKARNHLRTTALLLLLRHACADCDVCLESKVKMYNELCLLAAQEQEQEPGKRVDAGAVGEAGAEYVDSASPSDDTEIAVDCYQVRIVAANQVRYGGPGSLAPVPAGAGRARGPGLNKYRRCCYLSPDIEGPLKTEAGVGECEWTGVRLVHYGKDFKHLDEHCFTMVERGLCRQLPRRSPSRSPSPSPSPLLSALLSAATSGGIGRLIDVEAEAEAEAETEAAEEAVAAAVTQYEADEEEFPATQTEEEEDVEGNKRIEGICDDVAPSGGVAADVEVEVEVDKCVIGECRSGREALFPATTPATAPGTPGLSVVPPAVCAELPLRTSTSTGLLSVPLFVPVEVYTARYYLNRIQGSFCAEQCSCSITYCCSSKLLQHYRHVNDVGVDINSNPEISDTAVILAAHQPCAVVLGSVRVQRKPSVDIKAKADGAINAKCSVEWLVSWGEGKLWRALWTTLLWDEVSRTCCNYCVFNC